VLRAWQLGGMLVQKLRPYLKPGQRVFEVGAGIGATVKQFELAGMQAGGVEPHHGYREYGRQKLRAALEPGVLDEVEASPWYDMVIVHHVLEHLPHPLQALEQVRRLLRLGGTAYVEVPNLAGPHAAPGKQFHAAHIYNFTADTLSAVAAAAGFAVKQVFTQSNEENVGLLLTPDSHVHTLCDYSQNYRNARMDLMRYSSLGYYSRPSYLMRRVQRAFSQWADRVAAEQRLEPIIRHCAEDRVPEVRRPQAS